MDDISPRGLAVPAAFSGVILDGLASDQGLYAPRVLPRLEQATVDRLARADVVETAGAVLGPFAAGTIQAGKLRAILRRAYAQFSHPSVVPLVEVAPRRCVRA